MDVITILAFVIGLVIAGAFYIIKNKKLIKADKIASQVIAILTKALDNYSDAIKEYDKENSTDYFETLTKLLKRINDMEADEDITPLEFALDVVEMYEDVEAILKNINLLDKVVVLEDKE